MDAAACGRQFSPHHHQSQHHYLLPHRRPLQRPPSESVRRFASIGSAALSPRRRSVLSPCPHLPSPPLPSPCVRAPASPPQQLTALEEGHESVCLQRSQQRSSSSLGGGYMSYAEEDTCHIYEPIALTTAFVSTSQCMCASVPVCRCVVLAGEGGGGGSVPVCRCVVLAGSPASSGVTARASWIATRAPAPASVSTGSGGGYQEGIWSEYCMCINIGKYRYVSVYIGTMRQVCPKALRISAHIRGRSWSIRGSAHRRGYERVHRMSCLSLRAWRLHTSSSSSFTSFSFTSSAFSSSSSS